VATDAVADRFGAGVRAGRAGGKTPSRHTVAEIDVLRAVAPFPGGLIGQPAGPAGRAAAAASAARTWPIRSLAVNGFWM
jgi:hypothetical protein